LEQSTALSFAGLLRQLRVEARLTQEELAEKASLSPRSISDLERGINRTARKDTALLLAEALELPVVMRAQFVAAARGRIPAEDALCARTQGGPEVTAQPGTGPTAPGEWRDDADASNHVWMNLAASGSFVGRTKELGLLQEAWSKATAGHRVLALVAGEPGIGKTALTAELARLVHADHGQVLFGRWDEEVLAPYQAFREALGDYARACPEELLRQDLHDLAGEMARLYPEFGRHIDTAASPLTGVAEAERFRLFESLDMWLQRMAARRPVLLVLDDLQWADRPSLLLLLHLLQARRSTPLLTVAMYRDVDLQRSDLLATLAAFARDTDCRRLSIGRLERDAIAALLEAAIGRPLELPESAVIAELEKDTAGNPFFLLQMARHLKELGTFQNGVVRFSDGLAIPEAVRDLVRWRVRRVSSECAEVLSLASVLGELFDATLLGLAGSLDDAACIDLLEEAARAGLIAEIHGVPDWWRFSHALTRRVIADDLSASRTARLHERIGKALESRFSASSAELAHHFGAAASISDAAEKAVRYERLAATRALEEVAAEVAVRHYRRAIDLLERVGPDDEALRCELLLELAAAHDQAGEYAPRDDLFAAAADIARRLGRTDLLLRAALGYGGVLPAYVSPDTRARALLEDALERLGPEPSAARASTLARLVHWLHNERPYRERLALSDQSVALARRSGDRRALATVLMHRCWGLDGPSNVRDALDVAAEILDIGAELGESKLTLEGLRLRLAAQFENGEQHAAAQTAAAMTELAQNVRHPEFMRLATMWSVTLASVEGRFAEAEELSAGLNSWLHRIGHPQAQVIALAQTFSWRWLQGRAGEFTPIFEALSASEPANLTWRAVNVWCLAEGGSLDQAADLLARLTPAAAAAADENYLWWATFVGFADAVDLLQDRPWADVLYDLAAPYAGTNCTLGVASFFGAVDHWLGVLAAVAGRRAEALSHLEAALERHRAMRSRPLEALTELAYGTVLSLSGDAADAGRAREHAESALRTADDLGLAAIKYRAQLHR
jgi:transcriptional regulator with XRE-family HTH domain/tetratricopeptide (TPR) repeat protein